SRGSSRSCGGRRAESATEQPERHDRRRREALLTRRASPVEPSTGGPMNDRIFELKRLSPDAIDAALQRAQHYRYLNQPHLAESICRDILDAAPDHEEA